MSEHIDITATDSDGTVLDSTTLTLGSDALDSVSASIAPDAGRRGFLGGALAAVGSLALVGSASAQEASRTLTIDGSDTAGTSDYEFTVSGDLSGGDQWDTVDGSTATGAVADWRDEFVFTGEVTDFFIDGDADVRVDGSPVDPATLGTSDTTDTAETAGRPAPPQDGIWHVAPSDSLQDALSAAGDAGGGEVRLLAGVHSDHDYPVEIPNGVSLRGVNHSVGATVHASSCVLDADGGIAIEPASTDTAGSFTIESLAVWGTIRINAPTNRNFIVRDVYIEDADSSVGSGRGLEIRNSSYLYRVENVQVGGCDGAGVYVLGDGQATFDSVAAFYCGHERDYCNHYYSSRDVGGGEAQYRRLVTAGFGDSAADPSIDGIVFDASYIPDIYSPQVEDIPRDGIRFTNEHGKTSNPSLYGGHIFGSGRHNIHAEAVRGLLVDGPTLRLSDNSGEWGGVLGDPHDGGLDCYFGDGATGCHVASVFARTNTVHSSGYVDMDNDGWHNSVSRTVSRSMDTPSGANAHGAPTVDATQGSPTFFNEVQFHDGSGGLPEGPVINWQGSWMSLIDGATS